MFLKSSLLLAASRFDGEICSMYWAGPAWSAEDNTVYQRCEVNQRGDDMEMRERKTDRKVE